MKLCKRNEIRHFFLNLWITACSQGYPAGGNAETAFFSREVYHDQQLILST